MTSTIPYTKKPFASSILLWVRTDQPRQQGMDYWKGPHSKIISATPGFDEYRQIHLAQTNPGLWPAIHGVETAIPADRNIDGVAEVTFQSALSPLLGRKQTRLAYKDEINVFRRTLLYAGPPNSTRWYDVARAGEQVSARAPDPDLVAAYGEFAHSLTLPGFLSRATGFQAFAEQAGIDLEYRLGEYLGMANQQR